MPVTIDEVQLKMERMSAVDADMCHTLASLKDLVRSGGPLPAHTLMLSGSVYEGATLPRWWYGTGGPDVFAASSQAAATLEERVTREVEIDMMYVAGTINEEERGLIEDIPGKPGFLQMRVNERGVLCFEAGLRHKLPRLVTDGYVDSLRAKLLISEDAPFRDESGHTKELVSAVFGVRPDDVRIIAQEGLTKASYTCDIWVKLATKDLFKYASDHVPAMRLVFWPDVAAGWLNSEARGRQWPTPDVIASIKADGCHFVTRPSRNGDVHRELRYSFSKSEMTLARLRSPQQKLVYFLFKTLLYIWIKPIDSDHLVSYLGKSIMLWSTERFPPEHALWQKDALAPCLHYLLSELALHLRKGHLAHFFIDDINLIADIPVESRRLAVAKLRQIKEDLVGHIPTNLDEMATMAANLCSRLKAAADIIDAVLQFRNAFGAF